MRGLYAASATIHSLEAVGSLVCSVDYVGPRDAESCLFQELGVALRINSEALDRGLILYSAQPYDRPSAA